MRYEIYRGIDNLVFAPVTIDENGMESWGAVQPLAGVQAITTEIDEANEVLYFDNKPSIILSTAGNERYTLTLSVPGTATRAMLDGKKYDERKMAYLSTPTEKRYYALGFRAGLKGDMSIAEYFWIYKGQFTGGGMSISTEDSGTTHNTFTYTFTSVYPKRTWDNEMVSYISITDEHPMAGDFLNYVFTPDKLTASNVFSVDFNLADKTKNSGIGKRGGASAPLTFTKFIGNRSEKQADSDFRHMTPWRGIHHRIRDAKDGKLLAVSGEDVYKDILRDPSMKGKYNLFSYFPKFWSKWDQKDLSDGRHWVFSVSSSPFTGSEESGGFEWSAAKIGEGFVSAPGLPPKVNTSFNSFNSAFSSRQLKMASWRKYLDILKLMWVETADLNSQRGVGQGINSLWWIGGIHIIEDASASRYVSITKNSKVHPGMWCAIDASENFYNGGIFTGYVKAVDNSGANTILDFGEGASITATTANGIGFPGQPTSVEDFLAMGDNTLGWVDNGGTEGANHVFVYGISDLWGNVYSWIDYRIKNNEVYVDGVKKKTILPEQFNDGWPSNWDYDDGVLWPTDYAGGGSNVLFGDYFYGKSAHDAPDRVCRFGGYWVSGSLVGSSSLYWDDDPDYTRVSVGCFAISK